jgi:hypothetical protein
MQPPLLLVGLMRALEPPAALLHLALKKVCCPDADLLARSSRIPESRKE